QGLLNSHQLEEPQLLDLDLVSRLERLSLLEPESDFGAVDVELSTRSDDLPRLCEDQLLLCGDHQRILKVGGCFSAKGVQVLLRDVAPQILRGTVDVRLDGVAIGALQARRDQRRAVQPISEADIVIRLPNVGVRAEGGATENLLSTLLLLDVERSVRARQQRSVSAAD